MNRQMSESRLWLPRRTEIGGDCDDNMSVATASSFYPSVDEIESIDIPSCHDVFARVRRNPRRALHRQYHSARTFRDQIQGRSGLGSSRLDCSKLAPTIEELSNLLPQRKSPPAHLLIRKEGSRRRIPSDILATSPGMEYVRSPPHIPPEFAAGRSNSYRSLGSTSSGTSSKAGTVSVKCRPMEIEVSPGVFLPLHGSEETVNAMRANQLRHCQCMVCNIFVFCVAKANFMLCPNCRVVSPVDQDNNNSITLDSGGVGLGMTVSEYDALYEEEAFHVRSQHNVLYR